MSLPDLIVGHCLVVPFVSLFLGGKIMQVKETKIDFEWKGDDGSHQDSLVCPVSGVTFQAFYNEPNKLLISIDLKGLEDDVKLARHTKNVSIQGNKLQIELLLSNR